MKHSLLMGKCFFKEKNWFFLKHLNESVAPLDIYVCSEGSAIIDELLPDRNKDKVRVDYK